MNYTFNILLFMRTNNSLSHHNRVENFIKAMDYEVREFGFSETANLIAEFFDECCNSVEPCNCDRNCNLLAIEKFENNFTVKKIQDLVEGGGYFRLKNYLQDRIFSLVQGFKETAQQHFKKEQLDTLEKLFNNSENIIKNNNILEQQFQLQQNLANKTGKTKADQETVIKTFWKDLFMNNII